MLVMNVIMENNQNQKMKTKIYILFIAFSVLFAIVLALTLGPEAWRSKIKYSLIAPLDFSQCIEAGGSWQKESMLGEFCTYKEVKFWSRPRLNTFPGEL